MLKKLVSIANVGPFRESAAAGAPELSRRVLILGANGSGKTTLGAVLRSLQCGDPSPITSRRSFGVEGLPTAELSFSDGFVRFDGEAWCTVRPDVAVFDAACVDESIRTGEVIGIDGERGLYRLIVGDEGARLLGEMARLTSEGQRLGSLLTAAEGAIWAHVPRGWELPAFLDLPALPDLDELIAERERSVADVGRANRIKEHPPLATLPLPTLPEALSGVLARTDDDLERSCEAEVAEHLAKHGMSTDDRAWVVKGLDHADDGSCPFCDAYIEGLPLISAYDVVFASPSRTVGPELTDLWSGLSELFGPAAAARLRARAEQNRAVIRFWSRHCSFDPEALAWPDDVFEAIEAIGRAAESMLDEGVRTPSEARRSEEALARAVSAFEAARGRVQQIAEATAAVNAAIAAKKEEVEAGDLSGHQAELERLRAIRIRHTEPLASLCTDYLRLVEQKKQVDDESAAVRARFRAHTRRMMEPYEGSVNRYLSAFDARFRLTEAPARDSDDLDDPDGLDDGATPRYRLVPDGACAGPCDGDAVGPVFRHALSSGDRTTLALALFLAALSQDRGLADKVVVFDDPCSGQDAYRRRQSVHEITEVARKCAQVIVLSHDATFLKQVWEKAPDDDCSALTLADHGDRGSKIVPLDLEGAYQGRTQTDLDDLHTFVTLGAGKPQDMIRKMRAVLEVHCRTTYPHSFEPGHDSLEEIVGWIRDTGDQHPARDLYDELDQINHFTSRFHHGGASTYGTSLQVDRSETAQYVRRTLKIVNALQA